MQTNWKLEPLLKFSDSNKYVHPPCTTCRRSLYPALTLSLFQSNKAIRPSVVRKLKHIDNYFNCRSIVTKFDELVCLCLANKPSIVCLTETWLCLDILDSELHIPNYNIVRQDMEEEKQFMLTMH